MSPAPAPEVALVASPADRRSGAFVAAWAAMLAEKVRPGLRLVIGRQGSDAGRCLRLVRSCRHERMLLIPAEQEAAAELRTADVVLWLPALPWMPTALWQAILHGRPVITSKASGLRTWFGEEHLSFCEVLRPHAVAATLCRVLSDRPAAHARAAAARTRLGECAGDIGGLRSDTAFEQT